MRGRNGYTNLFATRHNNGLGNCCNTAPVVPFGYANALIGYDGLDTRYKAIYFTLDKNYTEASGWGFNLAYTLSKGEQNGNDLFSLDGTDARCLRLARRARATSVTGWSCRASSICRSASSSRR